MTEDQIQIALVKHIELRASPGVLWFHVPNGGSRHPAEAAKMKKMGVRPGVADLLFFSMGENFALELKSLNGRHSNAQKDFGSDWKGMAQGEYYVAYGLDEALAWLIAQGLIV